MDIARLLEEQEGNKTIMERSREVLRQVQQKLLLEPYGRAHDLTWPELADNIRCTLAALELNLNPIE